MKLLEVARILSLLDESIDIHGLARLHKDDPEFDRAVKEYRATLQGRKKELLKPYGLDDLDKFKENPEGFIDAVGKASADFAAEKDAKALYNRIYEDEKCLITMPKGPKGAAAAGSLCKIDGIPKCPWCVCLKYPENEKYWESYRAAALFFVYAKEGGVITDACCVLLTAGNALAVIKGKLSYSQVEDLSNNGNSCKPEQQAAILKDVCGKAGMDTRKLCRVFKQGLSPMAAELERKVADYDIFELIDDNEAVLVKERLAKGQIDVHQRREGVGSTPLMHAVVRNMVEVCSMLIDAGAEVDARNCCGRTPLIMASCGRNAELCRLLVDAGADVNAKDNNGDTPLAGAACVGNAEVVECLIEMGADIEAPNHDAKPPIVAAADCGNFDICEVLARAGADVNALGGYAELGRWTALMHAALQGNDKACRMLLDAGADAAAKGSDGATPLGLAAARNYSGICRMLLDAGADVNSRDKKGRTPLALARSKGHRKVEELLLQAGARE